MKLSQPNRLAAFRALILLVTLAVAWSATRFAQEAIVLRSILIGYGAFFLLSLFIGARARRQTSAPVSLLFLFGDLVALGAVGCWLHTGFEPQIAFLSGYVVAVLVAVVGRSLAAAVLGSLAGTMTMGLTIALFAVLTHTAPDPLNIACQVVLLACASLLTARVTGCLEEETRRRQLNQRLEAAIREREAEAAELVSFAQALAASGSLQDLAESVVRHLRCHLSVRGRAVALESNGNGVALWEEDGRLTPDHVERRRTLLQGALVRVGNGYEIGRLEVRSAGSRTLPQGIDFRTIVEVPIRAGGRTAGVLYLGDPHRGAIEERRIGVVADVARRVGQAVQRIEQQGTEEHRRTALLLRQMREGVMLLASDGRVLLANPAAHAMLGCPGTVTPLPNAIGEVLLADLARTPAGVSRRFRVRLQPDPKRVPAQLACTAVGVVDGMTRLGTLVTLADVTDEEQAQARLLQSEKLTLVGQTLSGVAHELNNPLTALIGYADLLKAREVDPSLERTLGKMQEQAVRATRIVKNLLSVARQRNPERSPVHIGQVANSVVELFAYEARLSNVKLDIDIPSTLPKVLGDPHALQQIFVNLVQNAIHVLQDHTGERTIRVRMEALPNSLLATVTDSGPGIPEELRTRVFESFFTTKGPNKGTGLGLTLSRAIAREHGGDLILDEDQVPGARFVLKLPILATTSVAQPIDTPFGPPTLGLNVLVVDDEKDVREAIVAQLGRLGCKGASTSTAMEAARLVDQNLYDVILTDLRMPGLTGIDCYRLVAEKDPVKAKRFVFMTGDVTNEDLLEDVKATGRRLLEKPFDIEEMIEILRSYTPTIAPPSETPRTRATAPPTPGHPRKPAAPSASKTPTPATAPSSPSGPSAPSPEEEDPGKPLQRRETIEALDRVLP